MHFFKFVAIIAVAISPASSAVADEDRRHCRSGYYQCYHPPYGPAQIQVCVNGEYVLSYICRPGYSCFGNRYHGYHCGR
ncbi:hypothetical protein GGR54DRAFT_614165 [Hypoxylon sp. NC1633]|nr:hypothetical protein GGR54DRAFT_614165 [Hypoxylon sp. NC1633]